MRQYKLGNATTPNAENMSSAVFDLLCGNTRTEIWRSWWVNVVTFSLRAHHQKILHLLFYPCSLQNRVN